MENAEAIKIILDVCSSNMVKPIAIALLRDPFAQQEVDDVSEINLGRLQLALIYKSDRDCDTDKLYKDFYKIKKDRPEFSIQEYDVDSCSGLTSVLNNLKSTDGYEVVWRDDAFTEKPDLNSLLKPIELSYEANFYNSFEISISYETLVSFKKNVNKKSESTSDLFKRVLKDHYLFDKIVGNSSYPLDVAKLDGVYFTEIGIKFKFHILYSTGVRNESKDILPVFSKEEITEMMWATGHFASNRINTAIKNNLPE